MSTFQIHQPSRINLKMRKDKIGKRYGRLLVLKRVGRDKWKTTCYECICDCGVTKIIRATNLVRGNTRSCGCLRRELVGNKNRTHGLTFTSEYVAWILMKRRCYNRKSKDYIWYGKRGITVCDRWLSSFENFLEDMGERPSKRHSVERKDNEKGYCPDNCKWATPKEQANNKRTNHLVEFNGKRMTLMQWERELGIPNTRIRARLKLGYTPEQAITLKRYEYR